MKFAIFLLIFSALPMFAGEKANPYQVVYSQTNGDFHIQNGMDKDVNISLYNGMFSHTYRVPAKGELTTDFPYDVETERRACIAPALATDNNAPGNDGFICK